MAFPGPSSPLSDLDETSFYTALESPATPFPSKPAETAVDNGAASHSVPLPSSAWSHTEEAPTRTSLVEAESLSRELTQHCAIYLEEQLCMHPPRTIARHALAAYAESRP